MKSTNCRQGIVQKSEALGFESEILETEGMVSCEMIKISEGRRHGQEKCHVTIISH
jgi:hypothetical protein